MARVLLHTQRRKRFEIGILWSSMGFYGIPLVKVELLGLATCK